MDKAQPDMLPGFPPELNIDWAERAAIREFDAGLPSAEAERLAFADLKQTGMLAENNAGPYQSRM